MPAILLPRSQYVNARDFGMSPTASASANAIALQKAIDGAARGRGYRVFIPGGRYPIDASIIVPGAAQIFGEGGQPGILDGGGSELYWTGAAGSYVIVTANDAETDWSRGNIQDLRVTNGAAIATGSGIHVRNPQNNARLRNVTVSGFPTSQVVIEGTKSDGTSPGFAFLDNCFFIGGQKPLHIKSGVQQLAVNNGGVDTDATSICGVLIEPGQYPSEAARWPVLFQSFKVEIASTSGDIPGFWMKTVAPMVFTSCAVQHNRASMTGAETAAGFYYDNDVRRYPNLNIIGCTIWKMGNGLTVNQGGIRIPNPTGGTGPWNFSFNSESGEFAHTFVRADIGAGAAGSGAPLCGLTGVVPSAGQAMHRRGIITGASVQLSAAPTTGYVQAVLLKNAATNVTAVQPQAGSTFAYINLVNPWTGANVPAAAAQNFVAGDRYGFFINTSADLAPAGSIDVICTLYGRFY